MPGKNGDLGSMMDKIPLGCLTGKLFFFFSHLHLSNASFSLSSVRPSCHFGSGLRLAPPKRPLTSQVKSSQVIARRGAGAHPPDKRWDPHFGGLDRYKFDIWIALLGHP